MMKKIVDTIVENLDENVDLDTIKWCIRIAMLVTDNLNWTYKDYYDIFDEVIIGLDKKSKETKV